MRRGACTQPGRALQRGLAANRSHSSARSRSLPGTQGQKGEAARESTREAARGRLRCGDGPGQGHGDAFRGESSRSRYECCADAILTQILNNAVKLLVSELIHHQSQDFNDGVCLVKGAGKSTPAGGQKKPKAQRKEKVCPLLFLTGRLDI